MRRGMPDAYEVLQVHPSAAPEVIEAAYRALARLHHPDLTKDPESAKAMIELNNAYHALRDPEQRAAYDRSLAHPVMSAGTSLSERMRESAMSAASTGPENPAHTVLNFGRYEGMTLAEISRVDPEYLRWLQRHSSGVRYRNQINDILSVSTARQESSPMGYRSR